MAHRKEILVKCLGDNVNWTIQLNREERSHNEILKYKIAGKLYKRKVRLSTTT